MGTKHRKCDKDFGEKWLDLFGNIAILLCGNVEMFPSYSNIIYSCTYVMYSVPIYRYEDWR